MHVWRRAEKDQNPQSPPYDTSVDVGGCTERKATSTLCNAVKLTGTEQSPGGLRWGHSDSKVSPMCGTPPLRRKWLSLTWHSPTHRSPKSEHTACGQRAGDGESHIRLGDHMWKCKDGNSSTGSGATTYTVKPHWQVTWPEVLSGFCSVIWKTCNFKFLSPISGNKQRPHYYLERKCSILRNKYFKE